MQDFTRLSNAGLDSIDLLAAVHKQELAALEKEMDADLRLLEARILLNREAMTKDKINAQISEAREKVHGVIARQEREMQECSDRYIKEIEDIKEAYLKTLV